MTAEFGPHAQMRTLAEQMAACYQMDRNLALQPFLAHFMEEVDVNVASDTFDHAGFIRKIRLPLEALPAKTGQPRRQAFLQAVIEALQEREMQLHPSTDQPTPGAIDAPTART